MIRKFFLKEITQICLLEGVRPSSPQRSCSSRMVKGKVVSAESPEVKGRCELGQCKETSGNKLSHCHCTHPPGQLPSCQLVDQRVGSGILTMGKELNKC